jgi:hypothetical protein
MPISARSRYFGLPTYDAQDANQVVHPTVAIRPPGQPGPGTTFYRHQSAGLDSFEYLAWRYLGSSEAWWRMCEANELIFPLDLAPGTIVNVPASGDVGRIVRTRSF